jgi:hypothetical protein
MHQNGKNCHLATLVQRKVLVDDGLKSFQRALEALPNV